MKRGSSRNAKKLDSFKKGLAYWADDVEDIEQAARYINYELEKRDYTYFSKSPEKLARSSAYGLTLFNLWLLYDLKPLWIVPWPEDAQKG